MPFHHFLTFASDAELLALAGAGFWLVALAALIGDRLRARREPTRLDRVGWMPWTTIFMISMIIGGGLLALALPKALFGGG